MTPVHLGARHLQHLLAFFESFLSWIGYFSDLIKSFSMRLGLCLWLEIACQVYFCFLELFQILLLNQNHDNASHFQHIYLKALRHHLKQKFVTEFSISRIQVFYPILFISRKIACGDNLHNYSCSFNLFTQDSFFQNDWPDSYCMKFSTVLLRNQGEIRVKERKYTFACFIVFLAWRPLAS